MSVMSLFVTITVTLQFQNSSKFSDSLSNFEKLLYEIRTFMFDFSIILGDFNARSKLWWKNDVNKNEGTRMDAPSSSYGLYQLISQTNSSSCIDLTFTDQVW